MLSGFERRVASLVFWLLFLVCGLYVVAAVVGITAAGIYAIQAAVLYTRAAKEEWMYGSGVWQQFVSTQYLYRQAVTGCVQAPDTAQDDADQAFLNAYSGGGETFWQRLVRWGKRLLFIMSAGIIWIPAMAIHGAALLAETVFGGFNR